MADASYNADVYFTQGSTGIVVTSSGQIDCSTATGLLLLAAGEIEAADLGSSAVTSAKLDATLKKGYINLDLFGVREVGSTAGESWLNSSAAGAGLLTGGTIPILEVVSTTDRTVRLNWTSANQDPIQFAPIVPPPDFTTANGITIYLTLGKNSTNNQTMTVDAQFWARQGETESGTVTAAITNSTNPLEYSVAIPAASLFNSSAGGTWNIALVPGAHANDALHLYGGRIEYTRVST